MKASRTRSPLGFHRGVESERTLFQLLSTFCDLLKRLVQLLNRWLAWQPLVQQRPASQLLLTTSWLPQLPWLGRGPLIRDQRAAFASRLLLVLCWTLWYGLEEIHEETQCCCSSKRGVRGRKCVQCAHVILVASCLSSRGCHPRCGINLTCKQQVDRVVCI